MSKHFASLSENTENQSPSKDKEVVEGGPEIRRRPYIDRLPREIRVHIFRHLSTFQLIRVSRVSRSWRNLAMDGSLWKAIDTIRYYRTIKDDQLRGLGVAASGFLRFANFRGCVQLSADSLSAVAEHCPNIERLNLTGCWAITSKAIEDVCKNMSLLTQLELTGLKCVNNSTLQIMATKCHLLQVLNLSWCKHISGIGLNSLTRGCHELKKLNVSGCSNLEGQWMRTMGMNLPKLRELCLNECSSLTDNGLTELLLGLSIGSSKEHRKWRMKRKSASSVRVSALGELLTNQSSGNDDNEQDGNEEDDDFDEESERESDIDGNEEADNEADNDAGENSDTPAPISFFSNSQSHSIQGNRTAPQARLVYLGLAQCHLLTQEVLRAISAYCSHHLRRLELSKCKNFGDEGLVHLAQRCTRLRFLDLEDITSLTDASLRAFAMYLPKLERICLSFCENVTDQGVIRMLRPAPNLTTLSTATATMLNSEAPSLYCRKLVHLELDHCLLITDRLLMEFANVMEERKAAAAERMKEKERKREERMNRLRQKMRQTLPKQQRYEKNEEQSPRPFRALIGGKQRHDQYAGAGDSSSMGSTAGGDALTSSVPVNIPNRLRYRSSLIGGSVSSYSSSPLQPRSVLASTSLSEEIVIKKTRPGMQIMIPAQTMSTFSTSSSSSLPLWSSSTMSCRNSSNLSIVNGKRSAAGLQPRRKAIRPTIQIFDCRNITPEGVQTAQDHCSLLAVRSYHSWARRSTSGLTTSGLFGGSGAIENMDVEEGGDADDEDDSDNLNSSQTSLHYLQMQQELLQHQLRHRSQATGLLYRARLGLAAHVGGHRDALCIIL